MNTYQNITRRALQLLDQGFNPLEAWKQAADAEDCSESSCLKGCPRSAFVGLAEHGHLKGCQQAQEKKPLSLNAQYCLTGHRLLQENPELAHAPSRLWENIRSAEQVDRKTSNGVVDVLLALWDTRAFAADDPREHRYQQVLQRIRKHQGEVFQQIQGQEFTYALSGSTLKPSTTQQNLAPGHLRTALERMPVKGPGDLQDLRGPSYLYAILMD
ncbi:DUF6979 family protein [Deinococcus roseus]|uniref:Uncharacterized protein n=1 Tax=Deinococcus roseus TaxID=392414 RepID=A0ABQ2DKS5_9DEIO|nr:hypothetical protein [Deinococcus roseus]GGJ59785.1 hypothetical protein GCM10008938_52390 [Deinococcus roseus]